MTASGLWPVYDDSGNVVRANPGIVDCQACFSKCSNESWLIVHLVLSFVAVAYVRWSRVVIHTHACNDRQLPSCCRQQLQLALVDKTERVAEKTHNTDAHAKENEVLPPTLALPTEVHFSATRLTALRTEYARYLHMLTVGLPRVVVNHKLRMEKKDSKVLDELLATQKGKKPAPIAIPLLDKPDEVKNIEHMQKIESFQRMIQVGVPRHLVEMKAMKEGVDPADLTTEATNLDDSVPVTVSRRSSISSIVSTAPSTPDAMSAPSMFTSTDRTVAMKVLCKINSGMRKKVHWSTKMYTKSIVSAGHNSLWNRIHDKDPHDRVCISSESRQWMEKLFVKPVTKANDSRRRTYSENTDKVSAIVHLKLETQERASPDDLTELEAASEVKKNENVTTTRLTTGGFPRKQFVMLLDLKKSQNIAIVLARVKRPFPELTREIMTLNCNVLSSPALQSLMDMWPDSAEQEAIDQFRGDVETLATAERFLFVARKIPRAQQKLRCLQFKLDFIPRVKELRDSVKLLSRGIKQVCASDRLAGVLEYIFHLGNLLNFGEGVEYTEWIKSISISSLAKLSFTKAYDGRITFLQYLIQSVERDEPHLALFCDQLPLIFKCSKVSLQSLLAEQQLLQAGLQLLINETQKAAVYKTEDAELRALLLESRESMRLYVMEVERELTSVQTLVNTLETEKKQFYDYFEEEDSLPIDELLGFIANFADEYSRERHQLILRARQAQKATYTRVASVHHHLAQTRYSL